MEGTIRILQERNLNNPTNKSVAPVYPVTKAEAVITRDGNSIDKALDDVNKALDGRVSKIEEELDITGATSEITIDTEFVEKWIDQSTMTIDLTDKTYIKKITVSNVSSRWAGTILIPPTSLVEYTDESGSVITLKNFNDLPNLKKIHLGTWYQSSFDNLLLSDIASNTILSGNIGSSVILTPTQLDDIKRCGRRLLSGTVLSSEPIIIFSEYHQWLRQWGFGDIVRGDASANPLTAITIGGNRHIESSPSPSSPSGGQASYRQHMVVTPSDAHIEDINILMAIDNGDYESLAYKNIDQYLRIEYPTIAVPGGPLTPTVYDLSSFDVIRTDAQYYSVTQLSFTLKVKIDDVVSDTRTYIRYAWGAHHTPTLLDHVFADGSYDSSADPYRTEIGKVIDVDTTNKIATVAATDGISFLNLSAVPDYFKLWGPRVYTGGTSPDTYTAYAPDNVIIDGEDPTLVYITPINNVDTNYSSISDSTANMAIVNAMGSKYREAFNKVLEDLNITMSTPIAPGKFATILIMSIIKLLSTEEGYNIAYPTSYETFVNGVQSAAVSENPDSALLYYPFITTIFLFDGLHYRVGEITIKSKELAPGEVLNEQLTVGHWYMPSLEDAQKLATSGYLNAYSAEYGHTEYATEWEGGSYYPLGSKYGHYYWTSYGGTGQWTSSGKSKDYIDSYTYIVPITTLKYDQ